MNIKKLALAFFAVTTTGAAVAIASVSNSNSILTLAEECDHVGNHYSLRTSSSTQSGTKEYWVCCKCHKHYLTQPDPKTSYTWNDAGVAPVITDVNDDRYIPANTVATAEELEALGFGSVSDNGDGTFTVGNYDPEAREDGKTLNIPENVTGFSGNCFHDVQMDWMVIPESITSIPGGAFNKAGSITVFFVGHRFDIPKLKIDAEYEVLNVGWQYIDEIPTPIK